MARAWTPASVRPAACIAVCSPVIASTAFFDGLLHRRTVRLALQAHEGAAIEFEGEGEAGHRQPFILHPPRRLVTPTGIEPVFQP